MKYCPNPNCLFLKEFDKIAEFRNDVMTCSDCGTMLEIGKAPTPEALRRLHPPQAPDEPTPLVVLVTFDDPIEANLFRARLEAEGISGNDSKLRPTRRRNGSFRWAAAPSVAMKCLCERKM